MKTSFIKKALAIVLSLTMILPTFVQAFAASPSDFSDFPTGWSREAVTAAVANGLLVGRTATTIEPAGNLTRAELATVINRAFGATKTADISHLTDVSAKDWFYTEIAKAVNMQAFQGDGSGLMRPNEPITREEVFAVIARALVLETSDYSALSAHPDAGDISSWAKPYAAILSQKGYIHGDEKANLNPKATITREEFAQIMHNIIKTYYVSSGTYSKTGRDSTLIRTSGVIIRDVTIDGDLIIGDGVGYGSVVIENVTIKGRLLCRGGEDSVRITNTKIGENVVVKDVNGVVHFDNYKNEAVFKNVNEITEATYKGDNYNISVGTGSGSTTTPVRYSVVVAGAGCDRTASVNPGSSYILPRPNMSVYAGFAGWKLPDGTIKNAGDSVTVNSSLNFVAVYNYKTEHYFETYHGSGVYVVNNAKTQTKTDVLNASVTASELTTGIEGYVYNASHASNVTQGTVTQDGSLVLKLYYDSTRYNLTVTGAGYNVNTTLGAGESYTLPTPNMALYAGFAGWKMTDGTIVSAGTQIAMVANRNFVAVYNYKIEHYFETYENSGSYVIDNARTETKQDVEAASVTASPLASGIDGYVYNASHSQSITTGLVLVDGSLVLRFYYDSTVPQTTTYTLTVTGAGYNVNTTLNAGDTYTLPTPDMSAYAGFVGWKMADGTIVSAGTQIAMVANRSFVAAYSYKVEHYFETYEGSGYYVIDNARTEAKYDIESATVTASPLATGIDGYVYNSTHASAVASGVVAVDGSLVLKLYYDSTIPLPVPTYSLTVTGAGINVDTTINEGSTYTLPTPDMSAYAGFVGWKKADGTILAAGTQITVTEDVSFVAVYSYKIQHYFQSAVGSSSYNLNNSKTETKTDVANAPVSASALTSGITGYEYNSSHAQNVTSGNVATDGTLILKFYYNMIDTSVPADYTVQHWQLMVGGDPTDPASYDLVYSDTVSGSNVGDSVNTPVTPYTGFEFNPALSNTEGTVLSGDALILKVYYVRSYVNVSYDKSVGVVAPGIVLDEGLKQYGSTITLAGAGAMLRDGFVLDGWYVNGDEKAFNATVTVGADELVITPKWNKLYAYTVKYYKQNLTKTGFDVDDTLTITRYGVEGQNVSVGAADIVTITGFTYSSADSTLSGSVNADESLELKLYYTRNTINISYSFANGGNFVPGYVPVDSATYGDTITLPDAGDVENGFDVFLYWSCNGVNYDGGSTVTIEDYDPQGGWVFTAVWETTVTYTVNFNSLGATVESYTLPENTSVPQSVFDSLYLYEQTGYVESGEVSPVYQGNEFTHKVKFGWFYNPSTNTWEKFTSSTLVTSEIVDENGILTVEERSPQLSIYAYVDKLGIGFTFARYYEPTVVTKDGSGNETITGTRAMDTFKNFLWDAFSGSTTPLQASLQEQIEKGGDKAFDKLQEKGIIDENKNILPLELFVRFSQIIGEEELEDYIVDNAKESLSDNNELKDAIFEYFERMANSDNPEDVSEVKSLFKEAIDRAIGSDAGALDMVRDICESKLNDPALVKTALKDFVDYDVDVTDADLTADATETIIKWTKDLIDTDPQFKANVKERLVKYITDNVANSAGFFDDVVAYNFSGTPFENITYPAPTKKTADMVIDVVTNEFSNMTPDEVAQELGYADLNALFNARKADILETLVDDLDDEDFFNHVISTTDFKDYTYAQIKSAQTLSIIIDFINKAVDDMTPDELAEFGNFANSAAMLDEAKEKFSDNLAAEIRDASKDTFDDVVKDITSLTAVPAGLTSEELFKEILKKVMKDAKVSGDYELIEALTNEDLSSMSPSDLSDFFNNFESSLDNDTILGEYLEVASLGNYTLSNIPSSPRELLARFVEIRFADNADLTLELLDVTDAEIIEKAKDYAKDKASEKVSDPSDSFLVEQIEEHLGITYLGYAQVPTNAFELVVDVVENKVNTATGFDDSFAEELGYTDMNSLFAEIEQVVLDDVAEKISTDENELKHYVEKYTHKTFTNIEPIAIDFVVQYAKAVLDPMTYDEIKAELLSFGMTEDEIDEHIEDYIRENIIDVVTDEIGYCPSNISSMTTKQFIIDVVLYFFDNNVDKRDAIIDKAINYLVDSGDLSDFEDYVDNAIEYLRETDQLDDIIDDIIETRYRDVLDRMIYQLVNEDEFEISSANSFILSAFEMQVRDYTFDDLAAKFPDAIFRIYPREKLEAIYNRAYNELLLDIEEGKLANQNNQTAYIATGLNFIINLIDDVYVIYRDRFVELLDEKATANYYYRENQYLRELVRLTSVESLFETNTGVGTGYAFKDYADYYNLLIAIALVGDDAIKWYTEELTAEEFDQLVLDYEDLFVKYANLIADMVGDYADDGTLPDKLDNNIVNTIESKIKEKLGGPVDKILNWYENSSFNRDYASDDYAKLRKVVNKAFKTINITTDEVYNLIGRGYTLIVNKFDGLSGIDRLTQISADIYEVTIKGKTVRVERVSDESYVLTVQGKSVTVSRKDNGNTYEIIAGENKVIISRAIVE